MRPHGSFAWNELLTTDPKQAKDFFAETLGWQFDDFSFGGPPYWVIRSGETMVGGLGGLDAGDVETDQSYWLGFIEVDEIDRRYARALDLGATGIRGPHDVPNVGRVAVLRDPTGALIGWMRGLD
ncbi:MAG TPA: VOC family protein [Devosiaceae bacterium]|nr:VOC family protein [Devosiaceae bacterium]